jgi:outer membrane lipase/esterase
MTRLLFQFILLSFPAISAPFNGLYFFGDSLTDTGNVAKASSVLNQYTFGLVPNHPSAPYVSGRFSDGPVWAEYTADRLGRPQDAASAGMSMGVFGQTGGVGNNYAVGGARTDSSGALGLLDFLIPTGMTQQVDFYLSRVGGAADPNGLYFLMGGGNDLRDAARMADAAQRQAAAELAAHNILTLVETLYSAGARQFMLVNAPNIGVIPESLADGVLAEGTDAAWHFNGSLDWHGHYLRTLSGLSLQYFDLFSFHNELVGQFGWGAVRPCKDGPPGLCDETLFFDSVHPTARVHQMLGNRIADQILGTPSLISFSASRAPELSNPEPSTAILVLGAVGLFVLFRARSTKS